MTRPTAGLLILCALAAHAPAGAQNAAPPAAAAAESGRHGGVTAVVQGVEVELLATPTTLQLYLSSRGQPIDLAHSTAQLTLRTGIDQQVVALKPAGDRLEAAGQFAVGPGTQVVATVGGPGHAPVTARFMLR